VTWGSNHIRYVAQGLTLRLTTDASLTAILQETAFFLEDTVTLLLGADESVHEAANEVGRRFLAETTEYWSEWVRFLGIPFEWQEAVIRAAITLKLNAYDDTGAIVAAMTTSIPEAAGSERNWDYRYCWVRDGYFVVNALNRLGATRTMERYLGYIVNVAANAGDGAAAGLRHRRPRRTGRKGSPDWPAIAAWARCASATWPTARCSTMSMVRSSSRRRISSSTSG
jgi:GH15 family glucan-1,4-alpha-glucosidase